MAIEPFRVAPVSYVFGVDRRGVVADQYVDDAQGGGHRSVFFYDARTGTRVELSRDVPLSAGSHVYYQNEESFYVLPGDNSKGDRWNLSLFNLKTGDNRPLDLQGNPYFIPPHAISRDKQSLLVNDYQRFILYHPSTRSHAPVFEETVGVGKFITNNLVLLVSDRQYILYDLDGTRIDGFWLTVGFETYADSWLSDDLRYGLFQGARRSGGVDAVVVDATPLREWLDGKGLLFRKTTGVVNAAEVRVRENPNLQAFVYGKLGKGDVVEVLDRSGIKEKIGNVEDWWYEVRRKPDGLKGWTYGAYVDLAEKQGDLKYIPPERNPER